MTLFNIIITNSRTGVESMMEFMGSFVEAADAGYDWLANGSFEPDVEHYIDLQEVREPVEENEDAYCGYDCDGYPIG